MNIGTGRNSAFSNHHIPSSVLSRAQLSAILLERHTEEEWVRLLHAWNTKALEDKKPSEMPFTKVGALMVSTAVTPSRKRKPIYGLPETVLEDDSVPGLSASSSSLSSPGSTDSEYELVPIPIENVPAEDKLGEIITKWDAVVNNVNSMYCVNMVDSKIGSRSNLGSFEDCLTRWEGLTFVQHGMTDLSTSLADCYENLNAYADGNQKDLDSLKSHINNQVDEKNMMSW